MSDGESRCHLCAGERVADPFGDHQVGYGGNGDRIHRHNSLRDSLFCAAQSASLAPRKEVPSLIPGTSSCPADIYLPNWCRRRPAALDVTVISTMQSLTLAGATSTQAHALKVGEERKMAAHNEACRSWGCLFHLLWNPWAAGVKRQSTTSSRLVIFWVYGLVLRLQCPHTTCSRG